MAALLATARPGTGQFVTNHNALLLLPHYTSISYFVPHTDMILLPLRLALYLISDLSEDH